MSPTTLTDEEIRTEWLSPANVDAGLSTDDDDATDSGDDDATDSSDSDATDSGS
jgi:hypothetical protein